MDPENDAETNQGSEASSAPDTGVDAAEYDRLNVHPDNRPQPAADEGDEGEGGADASAEGEGDATGHDPADDEDEIEHNGKKYRLPKTLVAERMMQQDYTRKTTELAEARKAFEAERAQSAEVDEGLRREYGKAHALKAQLEAFEKIDWNALNQADPAEAQALWMQRQQTKEALAETESGLQQKTQERLQIQRDTLAKAMQETGQVLARDIKDFSPALATEIANYGVKEFGVSQEEIRQMADPRLWKVLHRAMTAEKRLAEAEKKAAATQRQERLQAVQPANNVAKKPTASAATGLDDRTSTAEWLRRRNEQVAKRQRR